MGFTTGLLGGFTLTTALIYLSLNIHARNRLHQSALLHQQAVLITNIVEPQPAQPPPTNREVRTGVLESARDKWNSGLERNVRQLQQTDWEGIRERMEEGVSSVWRRAFQSARETAPDPPK